MEKIASSKALKATTTALEKTLGTEIKSIVTNALKDAVKGALVGGAAGWGIGTISGAARGRGYLESGIEGAKAGSKYGALGAGLLSGSLRTSVNKEIRKRVGLGGTIAIGGIGSLVGAEQLATIGLAAAGAKPTPTISMIKESGLPPVQWGEVVRRGLSGAGIGAGIGTVAGGGQGAYDAYQHDIPYWHAVTQGARSGLLRGALAGGTAAGLAGGFGGGSLSNIAGGIGGALAVPYIQQKAREAAFAPPLALPPQDGIYYDPTMNKMSSLKERLKERLSGS